MTAKKKTTKKKAAKKASKRPPKPGDISGKKSSRPPKKKAAKKKTKVCVAGKKTKTVRRTPSFGDRPRGPLSPAEIQVAEDRFNDVTPPDKDEPEPCCTKASGHLWVWPSDKPVSQSHDAPHQLLGGAWDKRCIVCEVQVYKNELGNRRYRAMPAASADCSPLPDDEDQREPPCLEDKVHHWSRFNSDSSDKTRLPGGQMRCKHCGCVTKSNNLGRDRYRQSFGAWPLSEDARDSRGGQAPLSPTEAEPMPSCQGPGEDTARAHHWVSAPGEGRLQCNLCSVLLYRNSEGGRRYCPLDEAPPLEAPSSTGCPAEHTIPPGKAVAPLSDYKNEPEPRCPVSRTHDWHQAEGDKDIRCLSCELVKYTNRLGCDRYRRPGESTALEKYEGIPASDPLVFGTIGQLRVLLNTGDLTLRVYLKVHTVALAASRLLDTLNPPPEEDGLFRLSKSRYSLEKEDDPRPTSSKVLDREDILVKGIQSQFTTLLNTEKVTAATFTKIAHLADFALVGVGQVIDKDLTVHPDDIPATDGFSNAETFGAKTMRSMFDGLKPKPSLVPIVDAIAKARKLGLDGAERMLVAELEAELPRTGRPPVLDAEGLPPRKWDAGNVVQWPSLERQVLYLPEELESADRTQPRFVCARPHDDGRFDYLCQESLDCQCRAPKKSATPTSAQCKDDGAS